MLNLQQRWQQCILKAHLSEDFYKENDQKERQRESNVLLCMIYSLPYLSHPLLLVLVLSGRCPSSLVVLLTLALSRLVLASVCLDEFLSESILRLCLVVVA